MKVFFLTLISFAFLFQVKGNQPYSCSCAGDDCFSLILEKADFQKSLKSCENKNGQLMTVRSTEYNDAIRQLLAKTKGRFWIGLKLTSGKCTDMSAMKGYRWTTGDNITDFTNWKSNNSVCSPHCVSISSDLKWTEIPCDLAIDGFLCENKYRSKFDRLSTEPGEFVVYEIDSESQGEALCSITPGTIATHIPSGVKHIRETDVKWLRGPWPCEVKEGGCEHKCIAKIKTQCICPPGQALENNNVSCTNNFNDPCLQAECQDICHPGEGCLCSAGYELREDKKACRDINECADNKHCKGMVCVNTPGSFKCTCPSGYEKTNGNCMDIDECRLSVCEQECDNIPGGYICSCYDGYIQAKDPHKCKLHCPTEECHALCDPNTFTLCNCPDGYVLDERDDGSFCVDINECETSPCDQLCMNTFGGFLCSCKKGFILVDEFECRKLNSEFTTPVYINYFTPTTNYTGDTSAVTPGALLAIIVCVVLMILVLVFLVFFKRCSKSENANGNKRLDEDMKDLHQVTTEKNTKSSVMDRDLKQDI